MMFLKSITLLAAMGLGSAELVDQKESFKTRLLRKYGSERELQQNLSKLSICVRPAGGSTWTHEVLDTTQLGEPDDLVNIMLTDGLEVAVAGDVVDEGKLDDECNNHGDTWLVYCIRAYGSYGDCTQQKIQAGDEVVKKEFEHLMKDFINVEVFEPGQVVQYGEYEHEKGVVGDDCKIRKPGATSYGDPHFNTWNGDKFDFHGGCDLVLYSNPTFANGLGLNIHVRTAIKTWWSYIESAVIQIGEETLEIHGGDKEATYYLNGDKEGKPVQDGEGSVGGYPVNFFRITDHQGRIRIDLGDGDAISMETYKTFVRVNLGSKTDEKWEGSAGLLGSFPDGKMIARDGKTVVEDENEFGQEWQVRPSEGMLFHNMEGAQAPEKCTMPTKSQQRRLGESSITEEEAAIACARVSPEYVDTCIFDVLATNDKDMAGSY